MNALLRFTLLILLPISLSSWAATGEKPVKFHHYENIYISATPSEQQMAAFKKQDGAAVLDLRTFDELGNCREPAASAKVGLQYNRVDFDRDKQIDPQVIANITKIVKDNGTKPILLFCKSGNRAAAWLAIHLIQDVKIPQKLALTTARQMGLNQKMEESVLTYLSTRN